MRIANPARTSPCVVAVVFLVSSPIITAQRSLRTGNASFRNSSILAEMEFRYLLCERSSEASFIHDRDIGGLSVDGQVENNLITVPASLAYIKPLLWSLLFSIFLRRVTSRHHLRHHKMQVCDPKRV